MAPLRFGILGCGGAALPVCEALQNSPFAEVALACDTDTTLARDVAERFGARCADDAEAFFNDPEVDAVYIAVPHDLLAPLARRALEAGKHALVEKPMALSLAEADSLIELAAAQKLALGVFYELRYSSPVEQARKLVRSGVIGRVIGARIQTLINKPFEYWQAGYTGRSVNPWRSQKARAGGGVVLMNCSHFLDALHHVTGLEVKSVSGQTAALVAEVEVEDTAAAVLRYDNGAIASLFAGAHIPGAAQSESFDLFGTEGQLRLPDLYRPDVIRLYLAREWGDYAAGQWHEFLCPPGDMYGWAVDDFAQAAALGAAVPTGGQDARRILQIVLGLYESSREGRVVTF